MIYIYTHIIYICVCVWQRVCSCVPRCMVMYGFICVCHEYIYIYMERERERDGYIHCSNLGCMAHYPMSAEHRPVETTSTDSIYRSIIHLSTLHWPKCGRLNVLSSDNVSVDHGIVRQHIRRRLHRDI